MAISINWATQVIAVPQADLSSLGGGRYGLDIEDFRLALKTIEDSEEGMAQPDTHSRNAPVTLSGVTYAQTFEIINGYTVTFEDTGTPYTVIPSGANHNLGDVTNFAGHMSLVIGNSAGLIVVTSGSGVTNQDKLDIADEVRAELAAELTALTELWRRHGLDIAAPLTQTATAITAGDIDLAITGDPDTSVTVTRQP